MQASKSAISQARIRLGDEVMHRLAQRVLRPLAPPGAAGAWYRGWRIMALDGSTLDVADEKANAEFFGYPGSSRGQSAFPQARLMGLIECGTHAVVAASIAPYRDSERTLEAVKASIGQQQHVRLELARQQLRGHRRRRHLAS